MGSFFIKSLSVVVFSLLNSYPTFAQFIDLNSENPYKKVFVKTDNFGPSYLDQLEKAYPNAKPDSIQFSMLNDLAYYWHTRNLKVAMDFTEKGLQLTGRKKNTLWEGRFQITQGAILLRMEKLDSAQTVLQEAYNKVCENDLAFLNTQLGYVYERRGQLGKATDYALESLEIGKKLGDMKAIAMAYSDLSNLFWKQSKFDTGLKYGLKSLAIFEERGITDLDYDFTLYVVGNNYLALKDYQNAQKYYELAMVIGERYGFYNNLSDVYISLVDLYAFLGEFNKADEAGLNAIKYAELLENNFMVMRSWLSIGKLRNLQGLYDSGIESLLKCIHIATTDFGDEYYLSQAYDALGKAYAGNHEYQKAYQAFAEYDTLKTRIFTAEADQRTSLLRTEFEVADKEGTISLQEDLIKKQKARETLIVIIAVLLFLLLLLAYKAISNNRKKNRMLQKQNEEKEFLLKEIHHRVKNNLEIVSSLLSLQSAQIKDTNVLNAMTESQHRVQSMGMIHQKLYMGKNLAAIEMKDYFQNLADYIVDAYGMENRISIAIAMDACEVDVDMAIPIGLIVNELLTNSLKYAFPNKRKGKVSIRLKKSASRLQLEVIDDGVGMVLKNEGQPSGFGIQLIELLTKQLDGKMVLNTHQGTSVSIQFQSKKAA
ncbi:Two-component sensor histidine kinase, contains HisKA and HATPase domains [Pricia antarctica]|uniref:histidine kinase n=1 Tax=Pricia antarctica TaxID=641691 RepID=A0A1G7FS22_9FLAO|nr:histidine kinase dimerization/phosphoacceptor domain -containing protein [Pricia antarctica]SDE78664.1 Two-component sensor histidine kinase, contains HisKA and HATPase domains [Pricia antarctica]